MTDETPDSAEESLTPENNASKKAARKRTTKKKVAKTMDVEQGAETGETPQSSEAEATPSGPPSPPEVVVDEQSGFETRETESENARRVSSKRVRPAAGTSPESKPPDTDGGKPSSGEGEEENVPVMREPAGEEDGGGGGKRRRRRRRRGGADEAEAGEPVGRQRPSLDPQAIASKAWKIFKAEVGEEGLALINDNDARELSRRSFRLAEIFLEEASRRQ